MAKPKKPLLSLGARGTLGDALTFQKRGSEHIARKKPIPTDPKSTAQLAWRQIYRDAVAAWHALSAEQQETWRGVCPGLTAYQCFMRSELKYAPPIPLELTFYPDADPEVTSVDGHCRDDTVNLSWAEKIASPGTLVYDSHLYMIILIRANALTDRWRDLRRAILLFDTSALPDDCTITDVKLCLYGQDKSNYLGIALSLNVYSSDPASDTALAPGDFDTLGSTPLCDTPITYANWNIGTPGAPNIFTLNAAGIAAISKTDVTKLGLRDVVYDVGATPPAWAANKQSFMNPWSADKGGDYRPKLVVTYTE